MLTSIQIILLVFILFFLSRVYLRSKEKIIPVKTALFWVIVWVVAIIGIIHPAVTSSIAKFFGVGRGVDVIIYGSISLLFYLVFRIYVMIEDMRREITTIVRSNALSQRQTPSLQKHKSKERLSK